MQVVQLIIVGCVHKCNIHIVAYSLISHPDIVKCLSWPLWYTGCALQLAHHKLENCVPWVHNPVGP